MKLAISLGLSALALAMTIAPVNTAAAEEYQQNASGSCSSALPIFDQSLRFRPVGVKNVGTDNAFVSCSALNLTTNGVTIYGAFLQNTTDGDLDISCTFVDGSAFFGTLYFPKTQTYAAGQGGFMIWNSATDNGGTDFTRWANLSCVLQPGVDLQYTAVVTTAPL